MKLVHKTMLNELVNEAEKSPRKRSHFNLHERFESPVQRLVIGLTQGSYVTPHQHSQANKWELMVVLKGAVGLLLFEANGQVQARYELSDKGDNLAMEIPSGTWHSLFPISETALILEIKEGPYIPNTPGCFATWAPAEGEKEAASWLRWALCAGPGDRYEQQVECHG